MNNAQVVKDASIESTKLAQDITDLIDNYLATSKMPKTQRIVNAGRAINAVHIEWLKSLSIQTDHKNLSVLASMPESVRIVKCRPFPKGESGFIDYLFLLFMLLIMSASFIFVKAGDHFENKQKQEMESCIMEQIELSEENRDSYFPRMRDELLHSFIMKCINDRSFRQLERPVKQPKMPKKRKG